ncbi:hypothetical protein SAMN06265377_2960 [Flagellimonas pacifica]|uniref:Uncharacterized protein n=1 Tax=Flagellimonas pacifica TaxID=1247520 RepID=A0A285MVI9_9FLAO|nr:hypothetical protein SAMN06265377_2960 [Allomuricauda parva]
MIKIFTSKLELGHNLKYDGNQVLSFNCTSLLLTNQTPTNSITYELLLYKKNI